MRMHTDSRRRRVPLAKIALSAALLGACLAASLAATSGSSAAVVRKHRGLPNPLSSKWSGQYGGKFQGTFALRWTQSGLKLKGTIKLSSFVGTLDVNGAVHKSKISFGTVGGPDITYTGTVSGKSMSGAYKTPVGGGSWSAQKTS
jgi:hypothetical protein